MVPEGIVVNEHAAGKRLILHIGGAKCGSSAIQNYLASNAKGLAAKGVLVPPNWLNASSTVTGEQVLFFEDLLDHQKGQDYLSHCLSFVAERMSSEGLTTAIISGENISLHPELAGMLKIASGDFDVTVVLYVRRQDDFLISAWQQWGLKTYASLEDYAASGVDALLSWSKMLVPWEQNFGRENIIVRSFQRDRLHKRDVVDDFLQATGISSDGLKPLTENINPSFDEHLGDLAFRIKDVFDGYHDNDLYYTFVKLIGKKIYKSKSSSHLMSLAQRLEFLARYTVGNEEVKRKYFPDMGDDPLFDPPTTSNVELLSDVEKLQGENAVLMRAVFALTKKIEEIEARLNPG